VLDLEIEELLCPPLPLARVSNGKMKKASRNNRESSFGNKFDLFNVNSYGNSQFKLD
jgi:hypothetical protein